MVSSTTGWLRRRIQASPRIVGTLAFAALALLLAGIVNDRRPASSSSLPTAARQQRENGVILLLLRPSTPLEELLPTLRNFEAVFNAQHRYPYLLLASPDEPVFPPAFVKAVESLLPDKAEVEWGVVPASHWALPALPGSKEEQELRDGFARQEQEGVMYAGREGYHHMCRWYAGLWARHPMLEKYDWYWRLEPGVEYYCPINYDPFHFLASTNKLYGFVITITESPNTIPTLWAAVKDYMAETGLKPRDERMWRFVEDGKDQYNYCHFWTNFELGSLTFFRSSAYQDLFNYLSSQGGFYTERWGDAPVRSLALAMLAKVEEVHWFEDVGYRHDKFVHCPKEGNGCSCPKESEETRNIDDDWMYSCLPRWRIATGERTE